MTHYMSLYVGMSRAWSRKPGLTMFGILVVRLGLKIVLIQLLHRNARLSLHTPKVSCVICDQIQLFGYDQPNSPNVLTGFILALWHGRNCAQCDQLLTDLTVLLYRSDNIYSGTV